MSILMKQVIALIGILLLLFLYLFLFNDRGNKIEYFKPNVCASVCHADKGEKGDTGPQGAQGDVGPQGPDGPQGAQSGPLAENGSGKTKERGHCKQRDCQHVAGARVASRYAFIKRTSPIQVAPSFFAELRR